MLGSAPCSKNIGDGAKPYTVSLPYHPNNRWPKCPHYVPKFCTGQMCSDHVPNWFSKGSPTVPNTFPIAPQIYPIWFAQSSTFMIYKLKRWTCFWVSAFVSILRLGSKEVLLLGNAQCSKIFDGKSINMDPSTPKKKKKVVGTPMNYNE